MKKDIKKEKKEVNTLTYLKRVKGIGIFGVIFSIGLFIFDIINYSNWMSIVSLVIDGVLLIFSIYFIVKSIKLSNKEKLAIAKSEKKTSTKKTNKKTK